MAKRKRLSVPTPSAEGSDMENIRAQVGRVADLPVGKTPDRALRQAGLGQPPVRRAPIADVAGEAAATSALTAVAAELTAAKSEGRMIQALPLVSIQEDYLTRDRVVVDEAEMEVLKNSLRTRGQQTPIEVLEIAKDLYGLISGYRRLQALRALYQDGTGPRTVLALVRQPEQASDAYTAMVEENEIRVGLSYFERANIVRGSVAAGVFATDTDALQTLFASASRSKRSKIKSFLPIVDMFGGALKFPNALTERLGLALAVRAGGDDGFATRLKDRLRKAAPDTADAEITLLQKALDGGAVQAKPAPRPAPPAKVDSPTSAHLEAGGVRIAFQKGKMTLSGGQVDETLVQAVADFLRNRP